MFYLGHLSPQELKNNQRDKMVSEVGYIPVAICQENWN